VAAERRREMPASGPNFMQPHFALGGDPDGARCLDLSPLSPDLTLLLANFLQSGGQPQSVFRVVVAGPVEQIASEIPCIAGRYDFSPPSFRFTPHFPFEPGLPYHAVFDPRALACADYRDVLRFAFSLPRTPAEFPSAVLRIFPSDDALPENLLRFYIEFTSPMRRGEAQAEIWIAGPDGRPVPDALYRAPVELWDPTMRRLTVLLDPGRLKRGLGPHRALGPPLRAGLVYELVIGAGLLDIAGNPLAREMRKRFGVLQPVRSAVALDEWRIAPASAGSCEALTLDFPRPLDHAIVASSIVVARSSGEIVPGLADISRRERRWCFTPANPWSAGAHELRVATTLEDACGNTISGAFDRPLRRECPHILKPLARTIPFHVP
jgi:hypothetical protein